MTEERREKRSKGHRLTQAEIEELRTRCRNGETVDTIAKALNCSWRCVYTNTRDLRAAMPRGRRPPLERREAPQPQPAPARSSRFYTSNFEPS
jgi:hypothetical protein